MNHIPDDPTSRAGYLLWQTAHLVTRGMVTALEPFDITPAQFGALVHIGREPGVSAAELARRVHLTPQSIQTALGPLMQRGLMTREPHPIHKRVLGNFLTADGMSVADQAGRAVTEADARLLADFDTDDTDAFLALLRRAMLALDPTALDRSSLRSPPRE